jgi:hypothetical protein
MAQNDESPYMLDEIIREMVNTRIDVLEDSAYYNQQMPYYRMFYDMLNDSVKIELLKKSTELWYKEGFLDGMAPIRGNKLDFYIKISVFFQHFFQEEQTKMYREKWEKEIGDSLHFIFYVDSIKIPSEKYQLYCVVIKKEGQGKTVYTASKGASSIRIPKDTFPGDYVVIIKYKRKYVPVYRCDNMGRFCGAIGCCYVSSKGKLRSMGDPELTEQGCFGLDAFIHTLVDYYEGTGIETIIRIQNLHKTSKEYRKLTK